MATTVVESMLVRAPQERVAAVALDPHRVLPLMGGFGRFAPVTLDADGFGEWDLFIDIGVVHVGGRVAVHRPGRDRLSWESLRGTRHSFELLTLPEEGWTRVTMQLTYELAGALTGPIGERLARGLAARHLVAGLHQLRHHVEHELTEE